MFLVHKHCLLLHRNHKMAAEGLSASFQFLLLAVVSVVLPVLANGEVPALFIFGDSTADVGTNNFLATQAKADFPYNGIDFPYSKPTGRFSNGLNVIDHISKLLGFKSSPKPFLELQSRPFSLKRNVLNGVNFASGGSGISRFTGKQWGEVVPLKKQIQQFQSVYGNITEVLSPSASASLISNSMFIISTGSNDLIEYYNSDLKLSVTKQQYLNFLQANFASSLQILYQLGARKFGIIGVPLVGCCPSQRANSNSSAGCVDGLNELAAEFHVNIADGLKRMSSKAEGMEYSLGDTLKMTLLMMEDPLAFGFKNVESACCGQGNFNGASPCIKANETNLCSDRGEYLFWDWFHPTEYASKLAALTLYGAGSKLVYPINFRQLAY